jgi:Uma2 family endonuclease
MEVSRAHLEIQANLVATLNQALCEHACKVLTGARVFISPTRYRYPDIAVLCTDWELRGEPDNVSLVNPGLLVEVVSPRTAYADFEVKPHEYRTLPTVQEYWIVSQERPFVLQLIRTEKIWGYHSHEGLSRRMHSPFLMQDLLLADFYQGLSFNPDQT